VEKNICSFLLFLAFWRFFANIAAITKTFLNLSARIILDATFLPNLMFLGLLSPEISFGELQCSALRNTVLMSTNVHCTRNLSFAVHNVKPDKPLGD